MPLICFRRWQTLPNLHAPNKPAPCPATLTNARNLDYSQNLYQQGTQSTQEHIQQRHMSGLPGVSNYYATSFFQVRNLNAATFLLAGPPTVQGTSLVFDDTFPNIAGLIHMQNYIGTDPAGNPTLANHLVTKNDGKTVVTSYPIP